MRWKTRQEQKRKEKGFGLKKEEDKVEEGKEGEGDKEAETTEEEDKIDDSVKIVGARTRVLYDYTDETRNNTKKRDIVTDDLEHAISNQPCSKRPYNRSKEVNWMLLEK